MTGGPQTAATIVQYRAAMARGAERGRAQMDAGDAGQSSAEEAARPGLRGGCSGEDAGRDGAEHAARPEAEGRETSGATSGRPAGQVLTPGL